MPADPNYVRNHTDQGHFCKMSCTAALGLLGEFDAEVIAAANMDDAGDHRPGMRAAGEQSWRPPPAAGVPPDQGRSAVPSPARGPADLGQTRHAPPFSSRIAYSEDATLRLRPDDR
ncbi:MAG: hypothetical protein U0835_11040 [Isosphaeraceae bacterium]